MVKYKQIAGSKRPSNHSGSFYFPFRQATKSVSTACSSFKPKTTFNTKPSNKASFIIANAKKAQMMRPSREQEHDVHVIDDNDYTNALMEMKKPRFLTYSLPKRTFQVLCKEASHRHLKECRFTREALEALQTAVEDFMVGFFEDAGLAMRHAKRKTLQLKDIELISRLRKMEYEPL